MSRSHKSPKRRRKPGTEIAAASQETAPYDFLPRQCIRLLEVIPCNNGIWCNMTTHALRDCPAYVALSYAWGRPPDSCSIMVNGKARMVRKNLWRFLREALRFGQKLLWIDALCIDQTNLTERAQQVQLMPEIYSEAESVTIWLGPAYGGSDEAMDGLREYDIRHSEKNRWRMTQDAEIYAAVLSVRPYWTRLWIVQEITLARSITLMCGSKVAPWLPLKGMLLMKHPPARGHSIRDQVMRHSPALAIVSKTQDVHETSLIDLMIATKDLCCADPRDRAYALLGMKLSGCKGLIPDYSVSLPALLNAVLKNHHHCLAQPQDLDDVADQCRHLNALYENQGVSNPIFFQEVYDANQARSMNSHPVSRPGSPVTLWWALLYNHTLIVNLLLEDDLVDAESEFIAASTEGDLATVGVLLQARLFMSAQGLGSALRGAAAMKHSDVVELVLGNVSKVRRKVDDVSLQGGEAQRCIETTQPLHFDRHDLPAIVLRAGALLAASSAGDSKIVLLFLAAGADINGRQLDGLTALQAASLAGDLSLVQQLLDAGAEASAYSDSCGSAIQAAASMNHYAIVQALLCAGAPPDHPPRSRVPSALYAAASGGFSDTVRLLLFAGARINRNGDPDYGTALEAASAAGHRTVVEILLAAAIDTGLDKPYDRHLAIEAARTHDHSEIVQLLQGSGFLFLRDKPDAGRLDFPPFGDLNIFGRFPG